MVIRNVRISDALDDYKGFFDHAWAKEFIDRQRLSSQDLYDAAFDLAFAWKGTSHTFRMPWLMVEALATFQDGINRDHQPLVFDICNDMADGFLEKIGKGLSGPKKGHIRTEIRRMGRRLDKARKSPLPPTDKRQMWDMLFSTDEFRISLSATQALCYGNLYFHFEAFLIRCMKVVTNESSIRVNDRKFAQAVANVLGEKVRGTCWDDEYVNVARMTRAALVHNGGRLTDTLARLEHPFEVLDDHIQIMAHHTVELFEELKPRANVIVDAAQARIDSAT